jgi:hypothetical protein
MERAMTRISAERRGVRVVWAGLVASLASLLASCAHQLPTALTGDFATLAECASPAASVVLNVSSLPIAMPPDLAPDGPNATHGAVARRITVLFAPASVREVGSVAWSRVTLRLYGGTIDGWTRVRSEGVSIEVAAPAEKETASKRSGDSERTMVDVAPGALTLTRSAVSRTPLSNAITTDVLILPGGVPVDEPLVRIPALWNRDGKPLAPDDIRVDLEPTRHVPGYDLIESDVVLDYAAVPRGAHTACRGSVRTRAVLVDQDGVRQPLWDLGFSPTTNTPRGQWLALRDSSVGAFRAVFDSPSAATSFANWVRATQATHVGGYQIGLFDRPSRKPLRPLVPVDLAVTDQFRLITSKEVAGLRVGPLGEP